MYFIDIIVYCGQMLSLAPTLFCVLTLFGALLPTKAHAEQLPGPVQGIVDQAIDGDTFLVRAKIWLGHEITVRVRLSDVDTPELNRPKCEAESELAKRAQRFAANRTVGRIILLHDIRNGKYAGRVVAKITTPEGDLGEALLRAGIARSYKDQVTVWCP